MKKIQSIQPKPSLFKQIAIVQDEISELEKTITLSESKSALKAFGEYLEKTNVDEIDAQILDDLSSSARLFTATEQLERYEQTLSLDLVHLPLRYIISDSQKGLQSPAGYHPNERVYIRPSENVLINSSRLPQSLSGLFFFDQDKRR